MNNIVSSEALGDIASGNRAIPFNMPCVTGNELAYIAEAIHSRHLSGDGPFTKRCHSWLERETGCAKSLLTHSCTAALEMAALLLNVQPGDEIIMPSFTFVSTANAFVLRGAVPVFVDVRGDTLNIDEASIEAAITPKTKAIVVVHYAGVSCEMDIILAVANRHGLAVVEDAAQGILASYKGRPLGSIGDLGTYSFHETKNIISGEGGGLLINASGLATRAEVIREKGTDRSQFLRGIVDKYTWQDLGSSFLPSELIAAFLWAQLENAEYVTRERLAVWERYHGLLANLERAGFVRRPIVPQGCVHNGHLYYLLLSSDIERQPIIDALAQNGVAVQSHYVPLHASPAGKRFGRAHGNMLRTEQCAAQLIRLPLWVGLTEVDQEFVVERLCQSLKHSTRC